MKFETEIKDLLINNTIHLIAEGGFEKATTKELTHCSGDLPGFKMNEVYIYRLFGSKECLYASAFNALDAELHQSFYTAFSAVGKLDGDIKKKMYEFFLKAWNFILGNEERCRCYLRYYYSIYFPRLSRKNHNALFQGIIECISPLFKEEADVTAIMHSVFLALFDFCVQVYNGDIQDDETNRPHVFNVLYCMMKTYFKESVAS